MSREILFRGKRTDDNQWIFGSYVYQYGTHNIYLPDGVDWEFGSDNYTIIPETVGQYTGLIDKNGTKIFEGDILQVENPKPFAPYIAAVKYEKALFVWGVYNLGEFEKPEQLEIIGNIHDNPELLGR